MRAHEIAYNNWIRYTNDSIQADFTEYKKKELSKWKIRAQDIGARWPLFDNLDQFKHALDSASIVNIDKLGEVNNLTHNHSIDDIKSMVASYYQPRNVDRIVQGFQQGAALPLPIILQGEHGLWIMAGNTRQSTARVLGIAPMALLVNVQESQEITELEVTKDFRDTGSGGELTSILNKYGWTPLGSGMEGTVAMHPNKRYVLKIFDSTSKYTQFVEFVQQHAGNPHLPRFSRYAKRVPGTNYSYVRMEQLNPVSEKQLIQKYLPELVWLIKVGIDHAISVVAVAVRDIVDDKLSNKYGLTFDDIDDPESLEKIYSGEGHEPDEAWKKVAVELISHSETMGLQYLDLHDENFMQRNGTLVILDPYF